MKKISLSIVAFLVQLCINFLEKTKNFIITIIDILDDGVVNNSPDVPDWCNRLFDSLDNIKTCLDVLNQLKESAVITSNE